MEKIINASLHGAFCSDLKSGNISIKRRRNPLSSRNTDLKAGMFCRDFRYIDLLDLMVENVPFEGKVKRECNHCVWEGSNAVRERAGGKRCNAFMERIVCTRESDIKISIGFDIRHIYEIVFGRKKLHFNIKRGELSCSIKGNILSATDGIRSVEVLFTKKPDMVSQKGGIFELYFRAKAIDIMYRTDKEAFVGFDDFLKGEKEECSKFVDGFVRIDIPHKGIAECFSKSVEDIYMLTSTIGIRGQEHKILHAGTPRFRRLIGRDALISSECLTYTYPEYARGILMALMASAGKENNAHTGEEPGRIAHDVLYAREYTRSPLYDTSDANALYLIALANYMRTTGDRGIVRDYEGQVESIISWLAKKIGSYGYVPSGRGAWLPETSWMDTDDRVDAEYRERGLLQSAIVGLRRLFKVRMRGSIAPRGTRFPLEMQVQAVHALRMISQVVGKDYTKTADALENAVEENIWNGKFYADLLNRNYSHINSKTSNMLYVLVYRFGGHVDEIERILTSDEFIPKEKYGIRTLSKGDGDYCPHSYQRGGVWPFQSYELARALMQRGRPLGLEMIKGCTLLRGCNIGSYLYEVYDGDSPEPIGYSSEIQAWSSAKFIDAIVGGLFGVSSTGSGEIHISPYIPEDWNYMAIENYRCGAGTVGLAITRAGDDVEMEIQHDGMGLICDIELPAGKHPRKVFYKGLPVEYTYLPDERKVRVGNLKIHAGGSTLRVHV